MAKVIPLNRALLYGFFFLLSLVALGGGPWLSDHLLRSPSTTMRWIGVAVAVGSPLPWIVLVLLGISTWDEFQRHVALVGTAVAFVIELLVYTAVYAMQDARLISHSVSVPLLLTTALIWVISVGIAALYYRTQP